MRTNRRDRLRRIATMLSLCVVVPASARADDGTTNPPAKQTRVYVGMWTSHTKDLQRGLDANSLVGAAYRGIYGGTFVNSYGDRAYAIGMQRSTTPSARPALRAALGYRLGVVTGYDERFLGIAGRLPAVPFAQLTGSVERGRASAELAFAGLTASVLTSFRL